MPYFNKNQRGFVIYIVAILVLTAMIGIALSLTILIIGEYRIGSGLVKSTQSYYAAETGIEDAIYRIKKEANVPVSYNMPVASSLADVLIDSPNANSRIITVNGNTGNNFRKLEVRLTVTAINPEFYYGAQAGDLGIVMENNSRIEGASGVTGNIYSNGSIDGDAGATITGDVFVATGMSGDENHTVFNSEQIFGQSNPIIDIAQSFKPSVSNTLTKVSVYIKKVGNPSSRTVRILTDSSSSPSKTVLASATLQSSLVGTSYGWVDIVFSSPPTLTQGTTYWLMIDTSRDNNDYWYWAKDQNQGYGNGQGKYSEDWSVANPIWTTIVGDLDFKIYMGGQATFVKDVNVFGSVHADTITNSKICGDAYYQTIDAYSLNFLNSPGNPCPLPVTPGTAFPGSPDPSLENMPISDSNINQWEKEATDGGVHNGDLTVDSDLSLGPQKIEGNLIMSSKNKTLTVTGSIYVTGHIDISNGSSIQCSPIYDLYSCVVVADGWVHLANNGNFQGSGQPGSFVMILSNSSCDGSVAGDCTDYNSAIDIHNNVTGAIFYAGNGLIYLHNNVTASELTARKIDLEQNAVVRYEQGLINANFTSGPGGGWEVASWKETE